MSSAVAAAYLNRLLGRVVGTSNYTAGVYSDADRIEAIRRFGTGEQAYADQIWDCATQLKAGNLDAALSAIGK